MNSKEKQTNLNPALPENKLLAISNDIAEYPPMNLSMHEWQALIVLSSAVNSKERPILGIDDIQEIARERGLTTKAEQNQLLNELVGEQSRFEMSYQEFFNYYDGDTPLSRKSKKDILDAMESMSGKPVVTANNSNLFASFNWFDWIINDKENKKITYSLGQVSKVLLMGLDKNFLQMMARLSLKEAKKYDIPIFLHMKSRLHNKKDAYAWTEPLPDFKSRFGHDKIPSYTAWKDYYRRVLSSAETYASKSADIAFKFEGKTTKGRKITHIHCKVWRIGNIHLQNAQTGERTILLSDKKGNWKVIENNLTVQQYRGYSFLKSLEVNYVFLLEKCLQHKSLKQEVIKGYEDLFLRLLWKRFSTYTKASKKGGAFVTWWRRGRLTEGDHYWATIEALSQAKKTISVIESDERNLMATMSRAAYLELEKTKPPQKNTQQAATKVAAKTKKKISRVGEVLSKGSSQKNPPFDFNSFKIDYPKAYQDIENDLSERMKSLFQNQKGELTASKKEMAQQIGKMLPQHCKAWYNKHILGKRIK